MAERLFPPHWKPRFPSTLRHTQRNCVLIALAFYGFAVAWYYSEKGNRRPGEEHGSAYWGRPKEVCAHFRTKKNDRYLLISKHIRISMNVRALPPQHQVNANILVIGGSGAGKTRFFIKPNLMQAECFLHRM